MFGRSRTRRHKAEFGGLATLLAVVVATAALQPPAAAETPPAAVSASADQTPGEAYTSMGFGVFLHYGLATYVGKTPWNYNPHNVPATVYDPPDFDPDQWMDAIAASGAEYVLFTVKHHDGFVMWPSDYTDYGVATSSAPDTDVLGEVAEAARERGLKVALYYSWLDKLHPGGDVRNGPPSDEYVAYVKNQLEELLTEYGPIAGIWLDTPKYAREAGISEYVHSVSPETAFIWKNFALGQQMPQYPDADVRTFEGPAVGLVPCTYDGKPAEQVYNVSAGPGWWQMSDDPPREDAGAMVDNLLARILSLDATLSLNVSPGPSGRIPPASVRLLEAIGDRLAGDELAADADTSASGGSAGHPASAATDLLAKTHWQVQTDGGEQAWLEVDFGRQVSIDRTAVQFTAADAVSGYQIQYLDADGAWRTTHTGGVPAFPTQTDAFDAVTTSRLRLVVDTAGMADGVGVAEFKAYGGLDDGSDAATYSGEGWSSPGPPADRVPRVDLPQPVPWADAFNDTIHRSEVAGDTATFTFSGNGVRLYASTGPDQGTARVRVDGGQAELVDLYAANPGRDEVVFEAGGLAPGEHTLIVEVTGQHTGDSTASWVSLDRITPLQAFSPDHAAAPYEVLPDGRLIYDDSVQGCAEPAIEYAGSSWRSLSWSGAYSGTRHVSRTSGDYAELTFTGTGAAVMAQMRSGHGIAAISIDGEEPELVDTYSESAQEQVIVWEKTDLEPGEHTVRITVTGDYNPDAHGTGPNLGWIGLDAIIVTP